VDVTRLKKTKNQTNKIQQSFDQWTSCKRKFWLTKIISLKRKELHFTKDEQKKLVFPFENQDLSFITSIL